MLWWFAETTLVAGLLAGVAALAGPAAHDRSHGPASPVAGGADQADDASGDPVALGGPPSRLDWPVSQPGPSEAPAPRPEVVPVCWEPDTAVRILGAGSG